MVFSRLVRVAVRVMRVVLDVACGTLLARLSTVVIMVSDYSVVSIVGIMAAVAWTAVAENGTVWVSLFAWDSICSAFSAGTSVATSVSVLIRGAIMLRFMVLAVHGMNVVVIMLMSGPGECSRCRVLCYIKVWMLMFWLCIGWMRLWLMVLCLIRTLWVSLRLRVNTVFRTLSIRVLFEARWVWWTCLSW